jgi:adenylate kinase family enzyme
MGVRIVVKGTSGSGKTTLAGELARRLGVPHVELDALHHGPNWTAASASELRARVTAVLDDQRGWVADGNYDSKLAYLTVDRAGLIVWLDLPLATKLWRLVRRTTGRLISREPLWNGNRERLIGVLWGREALFPWTVSAHFRHRRAWPAKLPAERTVRLRTPAEVAAWLDAYDPARY